MFIRNSAQQLTAQEFQYKYESERAEKLRAESKYDSALSVYKRVNDIALNENNVEYLMRSAIGMGSIFVELKQVDIARSYYKQALSIENNSETSDNLKSKALFGIGSTFHMENLLDSAVYYYKQTQARFMKQGDIGSASAILVNMSSIYYIKKEYEKAITSSIESTKLKKSISDFRGLGRNNRMLGRIYNRLEKYDSSRYFYNEAYKLADSLHYSDDARAILNDLAILEENQDDFKKAYEYRVKSDSIAQKIFVEGTNDEILNLREKYNTATLELENERQKNIADQQRKSKFIILVVAIALIMIISVWLYIVNQRRKNMKLLAEKNEEINKQQIDELLQEQEIASLQGVLQGQESERKRVAMDLHDRLGGMLSMVKLHFSAFEEKIDASDVKNQKFLKASELLDQATKEVREISHDLLSGVLTKFGLIPALEELKDKISSTGKLKVSIYSNDIKGALNAEQELQLYRIVQELLSNILKHAKAKETNIQLNRSGDSLNLIVEDDGVGFTLSNSNEKGGIGLINLKARVAKLNGSFHIDSGKGGGTTISIDIPLNND